MVCASFSFFLMGFFMICCILGVVFYKCGRTQRRSAMRAEECGHGFMRAGVTMQTDGSTGEPLRQNLQQAEAEFRFSVAEQAVFFSREIR